jgi:hypothetical protein
MENWAECDCVQRSRPYKARSKVGCMQSSFIQILGKNTLGLFILAFALMGPTHSARADPDAEVPSSGKWSTSASGCKIWDTNPDVGKTVKWSGACVDGYAAGPGTVTWSLFDVLDNERLTGTALKGRIVGPVEINYSNGNKYVGALDVDGLLNGQGTLTFANGNRYVGLFKKGLFNGQATQTFPNGDKYVGLFKEGAHDGEGTLTFANGNKYVGEFKSGKPDGQGLLTFANGDKYVGFFQKGAFDGQGTLTLANGDKYVGFFQKGLLNGQGTLTFANGSKQVGHFKDGLLDGQGTMTFANGDKNVGLFKEGLLDGQGTITFANGDKNVGFFQKGLLNGQGTLTVASGNKYVGLFKEGQFEGQGTLTFANGDEYVGFFQKGDFHGQGTITLANGGTDAGEFKSGKLDGQGTRTFPDGGKYVGEFQKGDFNGQGTLTFASGGTDVGEFKNGKLDGQGTQTYPNGEKYVGLFKNGALDGQGTIIFPNGSNYTGQIKGRVAEGIGTFAGIDGVRLTGQFRANFIEGDGVRILPNGERYVGQFHLNKGKGRGKKVYPDGRFYEGLFEDNFENGQGALYGADGNVVFEGFWRDGAYLGPIDPAIIAARKKAGGRGRFALLIANSEYREVGALLNPSRDVDLIEGSLKMAGFEVTVVKNGTLNDLQKTLSAFRLMAAGAEAAVVYYAGHGVEINGDNLLIPVDAKINTIQSTADTALNVGRVLEAISSAKISVVILDACRDNPFPQNWAGPPRQPPQGLDRGINPPPGAAIELVAPSGLAALQADNILIVFSAAPGKTAQDGSGNNSPFAISIAKRILDKDMKIQDLGGLVRDDVLNATNGQQRPYVNSSVTGVPFYLFK